MTSNLKRKHPGADAVSAVPDDVLSGTDSKFLYDPTGPLYSFKFIDGLVQQYCPRVPHADAPEMKLECSPRAYEESFLREPVGNEKHCANDKECEGMKIGCEDPFILREFYLPSEKSSAQASDSNRRCCLMCTRFMIAKQYFHYESVANTLPPSVYASKYYNVCETPGEYSIKDCIVNGDSGHSGLVLPVVLHTRSGYEFTVIDGVRTYLQQHFSDNTSDAVEESVFLRRGAILLGRESIARST